MEDVFLCEYKEIDIFEKARVLLKVPEQPLYRKIYEIIRGKPTHDSESFYVIRKDINAEIPFSDERDFFSQAAALTRHDIKHLFRLST